MGRQNAGFLKCLALQSACKFPGQMLQLVEVRFVDFNFCVCCDVSRSKDVVQPVETSVPFQDSLPNCWCRVVCLRHKFSQMVVGTNTLEVCTHRTTKILSYYYSDPRFDPHSTRIEKFYF